MTKNFK